MSGTEDLIRSLNLLPYFQAHPGASVMEAAAAFGEAPRTILSALNRLFCCGRPGLMPDDLVDLAPSYAEVYISNDQGLSKPLRLTVTEAATLLMTLETLEQQPGLIDAAAVRSAAAKLRDATGIALEADRSESADAPGGKEATPGPDAGPHQGSREAIAQALRAGTTCSFTYYSASSDSVQHREVTPIQLVAGDGYDYLLALEEGEERTFRLDRMRDARATDYPAADAPLASATDASGPNLTGIDDMDRVAELEVRREFAWLADYYPITLAEFADDAATSEWIPATMLFGSPAWLIRFVASYGDALRLIGPDDLADELRKHVRRGLAAYDGPEIPRADG